jgi:hypothetical protein
MSGPSPRSDPPGGLSLQAASLVAALTTVLYCAILICAYGFISLLTDREVVAVTGVGPLVGPVMVAVACALVFFAVLFSLRPPRTLLRMPWARAVGTALAVYLVAPLVGAVIVSIGHGDLVAALLFLGRSITGPFVICSAIVALLLVLVTPPVIARGRNAGRDAGRGSGGNQGSGPDGRSGR